MGISELRGIGAVGKAMSTAAIWREGNFLRGTLMEYRLSQTIYKGLEHLSETVSPFFRTIDFYDEAAQVGVSLKTVNAKENFVFKNITDNIDALVAAKNAGSISSNGAERTLKSVRLDIVIPKGYDRRVLDDVGRYAKDKKIPLKIFEQ
ncbi:hypothetical protein H9N25_11850 [Pedobacter riviphilus]|uniref:Uncharacterized protein n=1 Tax=Pedobacter riviphilus TaxID=2766984 RepID=A0ABX6TN62_9SPHI|nr:hypothetical protein [Pedobacter riviphilus]QNR87018.1 hypothetical protein H9N25_11850 [Pedobacter riviphilus]